MNQNDTQISIVITGPKDSLETTIDATDVDALKRARKTVANFFDNYLSKAGVKKAGRTEASNVVTAIVLALVLMAATAQNAAAQWHKDGTLDRAVTVAALDDWRAAHSFPNTYIIDNGDVVSIINPYQRGDAAQTAQYRLTRSADQGEPSPAYYVLEWVSERRPNATDLTIRDHARMLFDMLGAASWYVLIAVAILFLLVCMLALVEAAYGRPASRLTTFELAHELTARARRRG